MMGHNCFLEKFIEIKKKLTISVSWLWFFKRRCRFWHLWSGCGKGDKAGESYFKTPSPSSQHIALTFTLTRPDALGTYNTGPQRLTSFLYSLYFRHTYLLAAMSIFISLPQSTFLFFSPTCVLCCTATLLIQSLPIYSRLQQYHVWLDITGHRVAHLYHQELGSRIQETAFFFHSSAETQVQIQIVKCCKQKGKVEK